MRVVVRIADPTGRTDLAEIQAWRVEASATDDAGRALQPECQVVVRSGPRQAELTVQGQPDEAAQILMALRQRLDAPPAPIALRVLRTALAAPSDTAPHVKDIARQLRLSRRTLAYRLDRSGLPPARDLIQWARLLRVGWSLCQEDGTVASAATGSGFGSASAFRGVLERHAHLHPRTLHDPEGWDALLRRLARSLRAPAVPLLAALP